MDHDIQVLSFLIWMLPGAYLIGSIPTSVWVGKIFHGIDVRNHGSGNAGATNVMRVLGVKTGVPVLLFDMFKGWAAVFLVTAQDVVSKQDELWMLISISLGVMAVIGHIFPVFAGFRGGNGVATIAGVCFSLHPLGTASALVVFIVVLLIWKYVSLGSICAGISFPFFMILIYKSSFISLWIFSIVAAILLTITHRKNIERLLKGEENKASFLFKKGNS
ncbi:MAG: glycerol-3-phosphate 1-O-acyltransferase PlsY [Bacteroidales bacterium]|jgi:glycerol-3-phosphate acyltransferase PlsY|nr:glycerol-3-phosphate 1-O-acyltransferase PlsY [Bacteroidales bacterium]